MIWHWILLHKKYKIIYKMLMCLVHKLKKFNNILIFFKLYKFSSKITKIYIKHTIKLKLNIIDYTQNLVHCRILFKYLLYIIFIINKIMINSIYRSIKYIK